jgi:hypothetical protein
LLAILHVLNRMLAGRLRAHLVDMQWAEDLHVGEDQQLIRNLRLQGLEVLLVAPPSFGSWFADDLRLCSAWSDFNSDVFGNHCMKLPLRQ